MSNIDYGGAMSGLSEKIYDQDANLLKKFSDIDYLLQAVTH